MAALFVNHLTVLDFSYVHRERGILGESWIVDLELHGDLNQEGMVFDFAEVKNRVREAVESLFDHKLLVASQMDSMTVDQDQQQLTLSWKDVQGQQYRYQAPSCALALVDTVEITPEVMVPLLHQACKGALPNNVKDLKITLRTEEISGANYQYSHGLKKHQGDCQRMAHGHRSRLKILRNGKRDPLLEKAWALKWKDIYLGTREDLTADFSKDGHDYCTFQYQAEQGLFELTLPKKSVYLIDSDTTVELIAQHMADHLKQDDPEHSFEVRAYEGVMKGAIAFS